MWEIAMLCDSCGETEMTYCSDPELVHCDVFGYYCLVCRLQLTKAS